jgi:N-acetylneuraminic acid mutarotase
MHVYKEKNNTLILRIMRSFSLSILLLFIISSGSVVTIFSSVSAPELVEDSWNPKTPMSQARAGLGVVAVDGKIYAIGGITDDVEGCVGVNECYDPVTDSWVTLASMPTSRFGFAIVEYQGIIYCIGGVTGKSGMYNNLGINEVYDIATDSWSTKASMPRSGMYLHASIIDGKFLVVFDIGLCC